MRCAAITKKNTRCKNMTKVSSSVCHIHTNTKLYHSHKRFIENVSSYKLITYKLSDTSDKKIKSLLTKLLKTDDVCKGVISVPWVLSNYKKNDVLELLVQKDTKNSVAFALVKNNYACTFDNCTTSTANDSIYIDIICGGKTMKILMALLIDKAIQHKTSYITLSALPEVILWYRKLFHVKLAFSCKEDNKITKALQVLQKKRKIWSRKEILSDKSYKKLLTSLERKHLAKGALDRVCRGVKDCHIHGYYMTLCLV